jgi:hypothetical protein
MARASTQTDRPGGSPFWPRRVAFDVSVVNLNPTAVSHSGAGACGESFLNPNAGTVTRAAETTKTNKYKLLCQQRGMDRDFVPDRLQVHNERGDGGSSSSGSTGTHTGLLVVVGWQMTRRTPSRRR